jgi:hypothetical protein
LEKKLAKQIQKSQPYFEQKDAFNKALESQKKRVQDLQGKVTKAKAQYSKSLRNLVNILLHVNFKTWITWLSINYVNVWQLNELYLTKFEGGNIRIHSRAEKIAPALVPRSGRKNSRARGWSRTGINFKINFTTTIAKDAKLFCLFSQV